MTINNKIYIRHFLSLHMGINNFEKRVKNHGFKLISHLQDKKRNGLEEGILTFNKPEQRKKPNRIERLFSLKH